MSDPLSITASIIAILQLSSAVVKYLRDVGDSGSSKRTLLLEISATKGILETLKDLTANANRTDNILENVELLQGPLENYATLLKKLENVLSTTAGLKQLGRAAKWPFAKTEITETFTALERYKTLFGLALHADNLELSKAITQQLNELQDHHRNEEFSDIIRWLSPLNFEARHRDIFSKHQEGTGQWLLDDAQFVEWQTSQSPLLWCYGVPGAGKTVFASLVVEHLTKNFRDENIAVIGIYCDYRELSQQSTSKYLASLLGQLLTRRSTLSEQVKIAFQTYRRKQVYPTFPEYLDMVVGQMATFEKVYVIVDALDECTEANGVREELLEGIMQLPKFVSVMITSRHIPGIEIYSRDASQLTIRAHEDDIQLHVRSRLGKEKIWGRRIRLDSILQNKIASSVVKRASGMFLLAELHVASIVRKHSRKDVERALKELPEGLTGTYDQILQRISDQGEEDATLAWEVLSWLTYARRPLTASMLQHALAIRPQDIDFDEDALIHEETLLDVCAGLVVIDPQSTVILFVHYTTQEYFLKTRKLLFPDSPLNVTTTCLTFLLFEETTKVNMPSLYTFIADNWGYHARESPETEALVDKIVAFVQDEQRLRLCVQQMSGPHSISKSSVLMSSFHLAAKFDLAMTMKRLLTQDASGINQQDDEGRTPLYHAAAAEGGFVVRLLLDRNDVDIDLPSYFHGPPLHSAIESGQQEIAEMLLVRGASAESKDAQGQRPIHKAIKLGLSDILKVLMAKKVDVTATTHSGHTPLELALALDSIIRKKTSTGIWPGREVSAPLSEYTSCLRILLESYSIDDIDKGGMLFEAVKDGRPDIVERFLMNGASPSIESTIFNQRIPLHWAAEKGFDQIVELLLRYGSDVLAQDMRGGTPLHYASSAGREKAAVLLAAAMQELDFKAKNGLTAYQSANLQGHEAIAEALLKAGAKDLSLPSTFQLHASDIETRHRHNIVDRKRDSTAQSRTLSGDTISGDEYKRYSERLLLAGRLGDIEGVLLCLSKGVDVAERDHEHSKTALHWAAENGHRDVALLLLDCDSNLAYQDQYGETALHYAAESGHADIVDAFLKRGPDLSLRDDRGRTAMRCARDNYHLEVVGMILEQWDGTKEEAEEKDSQGKSLAHWAAEAGITDVLKKLNRLKLDISAFAPDQRSCTPLQYARMQSDAAVVELMTQHSIFKQGEVSRTE